MSVEEYILLSSTMRKIEYARQQVKEVQLRETRNIEIYPHYVSCFPMHKEEAIFKVRVAISEGARCGSYVAFAALRTVRNVSCKQVFRAHCS